MKLVVKKKDVGYALNASDVAITDIANLSTLKEGSFLIAFDNGVVITAAGTFTGTAGRKAIVYAKVGGVVQSMPPIEVGKSKLMMPLPNHAPAAKVVTFSIVKPTTITVDNHTGLSFVDNDVYLLDPTRRKDVTVYTDASTVQADLNALTAKVLALDFVSTCVLAGTTLTITFVAGRNIAVTGLGEFERTVAATTTELSYGDSLSSEEMTKFVHSISAWDGNRDSSIDGIIGTFTRNYGVENNKYLVYGLQLNTSVYSTGKTDLDQYGAINYIAIPEGDLAATNEGFVDIFKAAISGNSTDSGGASADASDN